MVHRYILKHLYGVDESIIKWASHPQEELIAVIKNGNVDAAVLIDQVFFLGERDPELRCLYTDGDGWRALTKYSEMVKHIIAVREPLLKAQPELRGKLLTAFKASLKYGEEHLDEIADAFVERYGGDASVFFAPSNTPRSSLRSQRFRERSQRRKWRCSLRWVICPGASLSLRSLYCDWLKIWRLRKRRRE